MPGRENKKDERETGFGPDLSCVYHMYTSDKIAQGGEDSGSTAHSSLLDVLKTYKPHREMNCRERCEELGTEERCGKW